MKADDVKKLQQKKYRNEWRHFLVEGEHLILELHKAAFHSKKRNSICSRLNYLLPKITAIG